MGRVERQVGAIGRERMLAQSPSVRYWSEEQWDTQLDTYVRSEIRRQLESFDEWLARRGY